MVEALKKLGYKGQSPVLVLGDNPETDAALAESGSQVDKTPKGKYKFIIQFAHDKKEAEDLLKQSIPALDGDSHLWLCYLKGSSKKMKSDLNRDSVREVFQQAGYDGVTLVSIDNDWSAFRGRHQSLIKSSKK